MSERPIAAIDIGKTHARLIVLDPGSGTTLWLRQCECRPAAGTLTRNLDIARIETWLLDALGAAPQRAELAALVPVAHGATAVLLDGQDQLIAAPDYEDPVFDTVAADYRRQRDDFAATLSPFLPLGLNLARQWYFLQRQHAEHFARVRHALLYPQYWAWRLGGVAASEITSLGCHTDLWLPRAARYSALAERSGWSALLPPRRAAGDTLGMVTREVVAKTGLSSDCRVLCGIHDSNASFLCHLAARRDDAPFALISSGTWTVILAHGADLNALRERDDMLANVDAHGEPVATARFMGGREYAAIAGGTSDSYSPTVADIMQVIASGAFAWPSFAAAGPFAGRQGRIESPQPLNATARQVLATLYVALMCDRQLDALGARGEVIIDGPLSGNAWFAALLSTLRPRNRISRTRGTAGAAEAARILCGYPPQANTIDAHADGLDAACVQRYRDDWRRQIDVGP